MAPTKEPNAPCYPLAPFRGRQDPRPFATFLRQYARMCDARKLGRKKAAELIPHYLADEAMMVYKNLDRELIMAEEPEEILNAIASAIPIAGKQEKARRDFFEKRWAEGESVLGLVEELRDLAVYAFPSEEHGELASAMQESQARAQLVAALPRQVRDAIRLRANKGTELGELIRIAENEVGRYEAYGVNAVQGPDSFVREALLNIQRQLARLNPFHNRRGKRAPFGGPRNFNPRYNNFRENHPNDRERPQAHNRTFSNNQRPNPTQQYPRRNTFNPQREDRPYFQDQRNLLHDRFEWRRPTNESRPSHWDAQEPEYDDEYDEDDDAEDYSEDPYEDDYQEDQEDYEEYDEEEDD